MTKQIVWSPSSEKDILGILNYLSANWDQKVAHHFILLTRDVLQQIAFNPKQFPLINKRERIRKCVLTKHNTLFYRVSNSHVEILRIYDTRQNPHSLIFE